jgi:MoaA/NifB/PqqE/SkfB family radical SAM enzyme
LGIAGSHRPGYLQTAGRLLWNGLKFRYHTLKNEPLSPRVMSLALTNRCNSHCIMCNIWKRSRSDDIKSLELSYQKIAGILSLPLLAELVELDLTGGEPYLREDLADIVLEVARLRKNGSLPKLRSIIVTTNGLLGRQIVSSQRRMLGGLSGTGIDLVSVHSMDGIGETHDIIRGTKQAFELADGTISQLVELRKEYPGYFIGIKTTILPQNIHALDDILDYALARNLFHIISPVFFTEARFKNAEKRSELMLGPAEYEEVLRFYRRDELRSTYFYATARGSLAAGRRKWACTALHNYLYIDFDGRVYPCEMISEPIGDLKTQSVESIWNGKLADQWRRRVGKIKPCHVCVEPGAIRYSACTEGFNYLKFLLALGKRGAGENLDREGFIKYVGN